MDCIPMARERKPIKHHHYDLSMSKRTRKPQMVTIYSLNQDNELHSTSLSSMNQEDDVLKDINGIPRTSLKEVMHQGNGHEKISNTGTNHGQGIDIETKIEEKSRLALVPKRESVVGVKKGGIVSRYVKVLSHLIKVKRDLNKKSVVMVLKP